MSYCFSITSIRATLFFRCGHRRGAAITATLSPQRGFISISRLFFQFMLKCCSIGPEFRKLLSNLGQGDQLRDERVTGWFRLTSEPQSSSSSVGAREGVYEVSTRCSTSGVESFSAWRAEVFPWHTRLRRRTAAPHQHLGAHLRRAIQSATSFRTLPQGKCQILETKREDREQADPLQRVPQRVKCTGTLKHWSLCLSKSRSCWDSRFRSPWSWSQQNHALHGRLSDKNYIPSRGRGPFSVFLILLDQTGWFSVESGVRCKLFPVECENEKWPS